MPSQHEMLARSQQAMARRFAVDAADGMKAAAQEAVDRAQTMLMRLEELGADPAKVADVRETVLAMLDEIQGTINRTLDREGEVEDYHQVDVSSLERLPADEPLFGDIRRLRGCDG